MPMRQDPLLVPLWGKPPVNAWVPLLRASNVQLWCFLCCYPEHAIEQTVVSPLPWTPWRLCDVTVMATMQAWLMGHVVLAVITGVIKLVPIRFIEVTAPHLKIGSPSSKRLQWHAVKICILSNGHQATGMAALLTVLETCARDLALARRKLRLCSANHRAGYFSNLACDWLSIAWVSRPWLSREKMTRLFQCSSCSGAPSENKNSRMFCFY